MEDAGHPHRHRRSSSELARELGDECRRARSGEIHAHAGEQFNVNSTPQLRAVLFEKLGLTPVKKTKTGPSTDADSLQKMAEDAPDRRDLLRYREVEKLRSTYADALPPLVRDDGRIHATFKQTRHDDRPHLERGARTSRTSRCARPTGASSAARSSPTTGCGLLTADYSQIELRVLAHLADDPGLIEAFERGADIHTTTAAKVFDVDEARSTRSRRRFAKVVNYGLAYGMEAYGLGQRLDIPTEQAREILDDYFEAFPNVAGVHGRDRARGEAARLHDDDLRPAPADHRAVVRQLPHPPDGGAHGAERAGAGLGRRHLQARDGRRSTAALDDAGLREPHDPHRARRARARGAARANASEVEPVVRDVDGVASRR